MTSPCRVSNMMVIILEECSNTLKIRFFLLIFQIWRWATSTAYLDNPLHMLKAINSWNKPLRPLWNKPSNFLDLYGPQPGAIYTYNSPLCFCSYCLVYFFSQHQYFSLLNPFFIFSDIIAFSLVGIDRIQGSLYHITELYAFKQSGE